MWICQAYPRRVSVWAIVKLLIPTQTKQIQCHKGKYTMGLLKLKRIDKKISFVFGIMCECQSADVDVLQTFIFPYAILNCQIPNNGRIY